MSADFKLNRRIITTPDNGASSDQSYVTKAELVGKERQLIIIMLFCITAIYVIIALYLSHYKSFWSPDSGARFAMIRNWIDHGSLTHWYYPRQNIDPTGKIHPLGYFLFHQSHAFCAMYEPLFPLICGLMYRAFGFYGLAVVPVLCGIGTIIVLYAVARRLDLRSRIFLPFVVGLGTPLLIYSAVFWDHIVMILLVAVAAYWILCSLQGHQNHFSVWAGATLGLGIWVHELMLALFLSVLLASVPLALNPRYRQVMLGLLEGFMPFTLLWVGSNWIIYGSLSGPHLSANMGGNQTDHPFSLNLILNMEGLIGRSWAELTGVMPPGLLPTNDHVSIFPAARLFAILMALYVAVTWWAGSARRSAPIIGLATAVLAIYLVAHVHWANGLFQATPLFIPALAVPWDMSRKPNHEVCDENTSVQATIPIAIFYTLISRATWLYILVVLINPMLPGVDWGSRYLLPVLPFLVLLAAHTLEDQYYEAAPRTQHMVFASTVVLVGISIFCQAKGLIMVQRNIRYNQEVNRQVLALTSPAIVFSDIGFGAELTAVRLPQAQFMVRDQTDLELFLTVLHKSRISQFTWIGRPEALDHFEELIVSEEPCESCPKQMNNWFFHVNRTKEIGSDLQFVSFVLRTHKSNTALISPR